MSILGEVNDLYIGFEKTLLLKLDLEQERPMKIYRVQLSPTDA